jgi:hypothetical protein
MKDEFYMKIFSPYIHHNHIYALIIFGFFIDFRQWYYLYDNGIKDDSWFDTNEIMHYFRYSKKKDLENLYFEPIPKIRSMFSRR